jgi:hypothetical protein
MAALMVVAMAMKLTWTLVLRFLPTSGTSSW